MKPTSKCVEFYYYMYGAEVGFIYNNKHIEKHILSFILSKVGTLSLQRRANFSAITYYAVAWSKTSTVSGQWVKFKAKFYHLVKFYSEFIFFN